MTQKLCRRLEGLEKISADAAARRATTDSTNTQWMEELKAKVEAWHGVPENQAWVAAQPPDYLRNNLRALRAELMEIASGNRRSVAA